MSFVCFLHVGGARRQSKTIDKIRFEIARNNYNQELSSQSWRTTDRLSQLGHVSVCSYFPHWRFTSGIVDRSEVSWPCQCNESRLA